jgi:glycosyltransferase involved in cell wall biosynthesis
MNGGLSVPAAFAAWLLHKPFAVWHQMGGPAIVPEQSIPTLFRNRAAKLLMQRASVHVGVSHSCLASKDLPSTSRQLVILNPAAPELENQAILQNHSAKDIDVLFVGRLLEGKGIFVLTEALARLSEQGFALRVCFVGAGPEENKLRATLRRLSNIHTEFPGGLDIRDLPKIYTRARCLVVPSTTHLEGMPLVIAEAFTFGVPVIGSDQPAIVEAVGDAGRICPQGDTAALAQGLAAVLNDESTRRVLSARASSRSELFSSSHFANAATHLVRQMCGMNWRYRC